MTIQPTSFLHLGRQQAALFNANNILYCEILVTFDCPRHILVTCYQTLVRLQKLVALEDMLRQDKETAWQTAKDFAKGRLGKKALVELVQALMALEYFLNL